MIWSMRVIALTCLVAMWAMFPARAGGAPSFVAPETVVIPAGPFIRGSDQSEREAAYRLDERAYGHSTTRQRKWYEDERRRSETTKAYAITLTTITNRDYAFFIGETGHRSPDVDVKTWKAYGLIHPYPRTRRHAWVSGLFPKGRGNHPVVLLNHSDARAYAGWLSKKTGKAWRLPTENEWEKAVRGTGGRRYPWGDKFDPKRLNSHDKGPFDTQPVGQYPKGAGPFGLLDGAGQVFEWTATGSGKGRYIVKGGSWDDKGCGICRPAARHGRPEYIKHILVGFRLVREE
jgi:toxoflavin biosynthesis protein ToxD